MTKELEVDYEKRTPVPSLETLPIVVASRAHTKKDDATHKPRKGELVSKTKQTFKIRV